MSSLKTLYWESMSQRMFVIVQYRRSDFDCEILMIANCEFFWSSQSKESQTILECVAIIGTGSTIAIIRIAISLDKPNSQSLNYTIKTRPTVCIIATYKHRFLEWAPNCTAIIINNFIIVNPFPACRILVDKLKSLGVPPGPLYAKLKKGEEIQSPNGTKVSVSKCIDESSKDNQWKCDK